MKRSIRIMLTVLGTVLGTVGFAQNAIVNYYYDDCGNRIERAMRFIKAEVNGRSMTDDDEKGWVANVEDAFSGVHMSLFPNPTDGVFTLAFLEELPPSLYAELCTAKGSVIERRQVRNLTETFDLTGKSAGIYMLRLTTGKETQTWKIIKNN